MAIKGKGKSKPRSGRVVTAGPRPAYVPPKVPWTQRTGAKFTFALFVELVIFALLVGFGEQSETDREKQAVGEFSSLVDTALFQGPAVQPLPAGALVLPEMGTTLTSLTGEEPPPAEDVTEQAEGWSESVLAVGEDLSKVEVPTEDLEPEQVQSLSEARNFMERGLAMYAGLAEQVIVAADISGEPQQRLIVTIQNQIQIAASTFDAGYGKLQEIRVALDLPANATAPAGGLPQGGIPGGGLPPGVPPEGLPPGLEEQLEEVPVEEAPADNGGGGGGGEGGGGGGNG